MFSCWVICNIPTTSQQSPIASPAAPAAVLLAHQPPCSISTFLLCNPLPCPCPHNPASSTGRYGGGTHRPASGLCARYMAGLATHTDCGSQCQTISCQAALNWSNLSPLIESQMFSWSCGNFSAFWTSSLLRSSWWAEDLLPKGVYKPCFLRKQR